MDDLEIAAKSGAYLQSFARSQIRDWAALMTGVRPNQGYGHSAEVRKASRVSSGLHDLADAYWLNCNVPADYASASELEEMLNNSKTTIDTWLRELNEAWDSSRKRGEYFETIPMVREAVEKARHGVVEAIRQLASISTPKMCVPSPQQNSNHLVILIHGFNTFGNWIDDVKNELRDAGFAAEAIGYGYFGFARFLSFPACRKAALRSMVSEIDLATKKFVDEHGYCPERISAVAHSFGSWALMKTLADNPRLRFDRIIFCGSIVEHKFDFASIYHRKQIREVVNHIGTRDYWPLIGESAGWGYGSIGSRGLLSPIADNQWHLGYHHSDFLTKQFCREFWIPFLENGVIKPADQPASLPLWVRAATVLPLRWLLLLVVLAAMLGVVKLIALEFGGVNVAKEVVCTLVKPVSGRVFYDWRC